MSCAEALETLRLLHLRRVIRLYSWELVLVVD